MDRLHFIFLGICWVNDVKFSDIKERLSLCKATLTLNFDSCKLKSLINPIGEFKDCKILRLNRNEFQQFPKELLQLKYLEKLNLSSNQFISLTLPEEFENFEFLNELWLEDCHLEEFPLVLSKLMNLRYLWMDNNQIKKIPQDCYFPKITRFSLSNNQLEVLGGIVTWKTLESLFLSNNKLKQLSKEIGELKELRNVNLSNNQITSLPATLGFLEKIGKWEISGNPLQLPQSNIAQNWDTLFTYCQDLLKGERKCNFLKLVVVSIFVSI